MNIKYVLMVFSLLSSFCVFAEDFYVVGEVTHSNLSQDKATFNNMISSAGATGLNSSTDGKGNQWRLQAGYNFNPYISLEAGYIDLGKADYKATFTGGTAKGSEKAGGIDLAILGKLPVSDGLSFFAKAGIISTKIKSKLASTAPATVNSTNSSNEIRPLIGVGAIYQLQNNLDLRLDFDHASNLGNSSKGGTMSDNMLSVGIAYNF
jgi:OOP family OmpA-OmpF porin